MLGNNLSQESAKYGHRKKHFFPKVVWTVTEDVNVKK